MHVCMYIQSYIRCLDGHASMRLIVNDLQHLFELRVRGESPSGVPGRQAIEVTLQQ